MPTRSHVAMRVAIAVHDFDSTDVHGRYCVELARRLRHQASLTIYANTFREEDLMDGIERVRVPAVRTRALSTIFSFIPSCERLLRGGAHDLVHAQGLSCWSADIVTGHSCNAAQRRKLVNIDPRAALFAKLMMPAERTFYRQKRLRRLIAISHVVRQEIELWYGWSKPVDVIYPGTDTEQFRPAADPGERLAIQGRYRLPTDRWIWLFAGAATKGLTGVIRQLPHFPHAHLLVISASDPTTYVALAEGLKVRERMTFHGFESSPELAFRASDVLVNPSHYDPFGMVGAEALASGLPVILGRPMGVAELIENGRNGMLIDPHDPGDLRMQLERLWAMPHRGRALGLAGRATIQQFGWDACAARTWESYEAVYREMSSRR